MLRFLALTDFSSCARSALICAVKLARCYDAEVLFLHVMAQPLVPATSPENVFTSLFEAEKQDAFTKLKQEVQTILDESGIRASEVMKQYLIMPLPLTDSVLNITKQHKVDLILTGISGTSGIKRLLIGSNAIEVMSISPVPVMIVPKLFQFKGFKSITVVAHPNTKHREGFKILFKLARTFSAKFNFCFVHDSDSAGSTALSDIDFTMEELTYVNEQGYELHEIDTDDKKNQLELITNTSGTDLLVSLPKKSQNWDDRFLGGFTLSVAESLKLPLLIIPKVKPE